MRYDCVVIGAGHNGLVTAAYLARAGRKVCVLERRHVLGGCCSTEELWPGYRVSPAAYVISLFLPEIIRELDLQGHGLEILPRTPSSFTPLPDGRSLVLGAGPETDRREITRFSQRDAERYPEYEAFLTRVAKAVEPLIQGPAPELPPRLRNLPRWWRLGRALEGLGDEARPAMELLTGAAGPIVDRWFESEPLRATLATDSIIGAFCAPSTPGSAYVLLHHVMGEAAGARGVWGYVRGGMGGLAEALASVCADLGAEIRREAEVVSVDVAGGRARGVTLADGSSIDARIVASGIDARTTLLELVGRENLPAACADQIAGIDYGSASLKFNLALNGLPQFVTGEWDRETALRGTIHISPTLEYIEQAFDDAKYGEPSREPVLEMTIPSTVDETVAPPGQHVASLFVQYAPYELAEGGWDDARKEAFAHRCLAVLDRYAPGLPDQVLHRQVLAPPDLERVYGLTGGNIFQGAMTLSQLGPLRTGNRTAVERLYLCGAATHPGGGVMGAAGRNAARVILRD
ncbi:MAG: phytoene desaturase family protein [Acidimicrobiia bacterium]